MSGVSVEELELLSFFEVEPSVADPNCPWPYNDYTYQLELGRYSITFGIAPAYKDLSLRITHDGRLVHAFTGLNLKDVRYHKDGDVETLAIVVSDLDVVWLRLRPEVLIAQDAGCQWS